MSDRPFQDIQTHRRGSKWAFRSAWIFGTLILIALIVVVLKFGEIKNFVQLAEQARPLWLVTALFLQLLTYVSVASAWRATLKRADHPVSLIRLTPLGLAKLFTDQAIPSAGMSGNIIVARGLSRRGVPAYLILTVLFVDIIGYYIAYMIMVLATLSILKAYYQAHAALLSAFTLFAVLAVGIPSLIVWLKRHSSRPLPRILQQLPFSDFLLRIIREVPSGVLRDPVLIFKNTCFEAGVFLLDALTLWVILLSIGHNVSLMVPFTVFIAASVVGTVSPVPMGLGTFEAVAVATLGMLGVQIEAALTATLLLRGFTFWLPMLPGLWMAQGEIRGKTVSSV
jgi:uncharacterized membrane protein YbhN (UPF0104 family)